VYTAGLDSTLVFHLGGYVNSQRNGYWSVGIPLSICILPLHDVKLGVWYALSATRIIGLIFILTQTVNSH